MILRTKYGEFPVKRKRTVAVSVVKTNRPCTHYGQKLSRDEYTKVEHNFVPKSKIQARCSFPGWARLVATFDLEGNELDLPTYPWGNEPK